MKFTYPLIAAVAAFAGCTQYIPSVGPDYAKPTFDDPVKALPDAGQPTTNLTATCEYRPAAAGDDLRVTVDNKFLGAWWKRFNDPVLTGLVESAVTNNLSFRAAIFRLEQANWELLGTYSAFLPKAKINAGWTMNVARENNHSLYDSGVHSKRTRGPNLGVGADWEIDIFGGSRRATESAIASAQAAGWTVADAWVNLTSEIGIQYVNLRSTQECLAVARTNLVLQTETYDILKSRLDSGIGDELAVNQCAYIVEQTRARIPTFLAQEESLKNALAILAGRVPGELHATLASPGVRRDWLLAPQKLGELPMNLVRTRPDVKVAERKLAAQVARIGIAKAQWFPRLFITGTVGVQSKHFGNLFNYDSIMSSFGPSVSWPIFQAGAIYSAMKAEEAKTGAAVLDYQLAIRKAHADVRDNYAAYTQEYHRLQSLKAAVKAATDAVTISKDLYKNGLKDFNNVLDAQRSRLSLEESLTLSRGSISTDLIKLYRSLGGGLAGCEEAEPMLAETDQTAKN